MSGTLFDTMRQNRTRVSAGLGEQTHVECFSRSALTVGVSGVALTAERPNKRLKKAQAAAAEIRKLNVCITM